MHVTNELRRIKKEEKGKRKKSFLVNGRLEAWLVHSWLVAVRYCPMVLCRIVTSGQLISALPRGKMSLTNWGRMEAVFSAVLVFHLLVTTGKKMQTDCHNLRIVLFSSDISTMIHIHHICK